MPTRSGNRFRARDHTSPATTASDDQKVPTSTDTSSVSSPPEARLEERASEFELSSTERRRERREEYLSSDRGGSDESSSESEAEAEMPARKTILMRSQNMGNEEEDDAEWKEGCKDTGFEKEADLYTNGKEDRSDSELGDDDDYLDDEESEEEESEDEEWYSSTRRKRKFNRKTTYNERPKLSTRKDVQVRPQLTTEQKQQELAKILESGDDFASLNQFLVCLLWDFDFRYTLLHHQYQGVLAVAGVDSVHVCKELEKLSENDKKKVFGLGEDSVEFRREFCVKNMKLVESKGMLLADDMGLGKTIQGLGGAILRNHLVNVIMSANNRLHVPKPTLILGPNDAVLAQWEESLIASGYPQGKIRLFNRKSGKQTQGDAFLLLTRYQLMTEMRSLFQSKLSSIFPKRVDQLFIKMLENQYKASKGKAKNEYREKEETVSQCITRIFKNNEFSIKSEFEMLLVDESHFLRNLEAFWGMGSALLGMYSNRTALLSGTPYNNSSQDMATQMTMIDANHPAADVEWWKQATSDISLDKVVKNITSWREVYMLRRDKTLLSKTLPPKTSSKVEVSPYMTEMSIYLNYEKMFLEDLKRFSKYANAGRLTPEALQSMLQSFQNMMAKMSLMRMSLIHPIIPGGREITMQFSPTRRQLISKCKTTNAKVCVCCARMPSDPPPTKGDQKSTNDVSAEMDTDGNPDDEERGSSLGANNQGQKSTNANDADKQEKAQTQKLGKLVPLAMPICSASNKAPHFIHQKCKKKFLQSFEDSDETPVCPRCIDFEKRLKLSQQDCSDSSLKTYCEHIQASPNVKGIQASSKIQQVIDWAMSIPKDDKVIIYSFFKATLDILEGIFVEHFDLECERFDGDVSATARAKAMSRFKESPTCRFLLVSVQSGGVGLNIVEANHVGFVDRWFNPCVHDQAEDRCYRLGQKKPVNVKYFDANKTVDEVMAATNSIKKNNAKILLADGSEINSTGDNISFKELGGMLGHMMEYMTRNRGSSSKIDDPYTEETLIDVAERRVQSTKEGDKKPSSLPIFEGGGASVQAPQLENSSSNTTLPIQAFTQDGPQPVPPTQLIAEDMMSQAAPMQAFASNMLSHVAPMQAFSSNMFAQVAPMQAAPMQAFSSNMFAHAAPMQAAPMQAFSSNMFAHAAPMQAFTQNSLQTVAPSQFITDNMMMQAAPMQAAPMQEAPMQETPMQAAPNMLSQTGPDHSLTSSDTITEKGLAENTKSPVLLNNEVMMKEDDVDDSKKEAKATPETISINSDDESNGIVDLVESTPTKTNEHVLNKTVSLSDDEGDDIPESVFNLSVKKVQS